MVAETKLFFSFFMQNFSLLFSSFIFSLFSLPPSANQFSKGPSLLLLNMKGYSTFHYHISQLLLAALRLVDLAVRILKYGPLDFVVRFGV